MNVFVLIKGVSMNVPRIQSRQYFPSSEKNPWIVFDGLLDT